MHQLKTRVQVVAASSGSATGGCASVNGGCCGGTVGTEFVAALLRGQRDDTPIGRRTG